MKADAKPAIDNQTSENKSRSLFEPIVISVPKIEKGEKPTPDRKPEEEKTIENVALKAETETDEMAAEKKTSEVAKSRPRVVTEEPEIKQIPACKIIVGQEIVSILNDGGNLSVLVRFKDESDAKEIKATSSSPLDVEIVSQPSTDGIFERGIFFVIKSISQKTGTFKITFEAACGKKEITVKVR
jgi:hypothetical protein